MPSIIANRSFDSSLRFVVKRIDSLSLSSSAAADPIRIGSTEDLMASRGVVLDLNVIPDCQGRDDEKVDGDSAYANSEQRQEVSLRPVIDVDDFDDDILSSSRRTFEHARKSSQTRKRSITTSDDDVIILKGSPINFQVNKRKKNSVLQQQNYDSQREIVDLEASPRIQGKNVPEPSQLPQLVPPTMDPTFSCPICKDTLENETSTKCGHIFCEGCIKKALAARKWCPVCRKKLRAKDIIRIYLPDVSRV